MPRSLPPTCSPVVRRRPCGCCPSRSGCSANAPICRSSFATTGRIPNFLEETLRLESPLRTQFRMARVHTDWAVWTSPPGARHARAGCLQP